MYEKVTWWETSLLSRFRTENTQLLLITSKKDKTIYLALNKNTLSLSFLAPLLQGD